MVCRGRLPTQIERPDHSDYVPQIVRRFSALLAYPKPDRALHSGSVLQMVRNRTALWAGRNARPASCMAELLPHGVNIEVTEPSSNTSRIA